MQRRENSMREESSYPPQRRRTPSFSSTLLDAICNSIDESKTDLHHVDPQQQSLNLKHTFKERMNLRQAVMIEDWMEKHSTTSSSSESIFSSSETDTTTTTYDKQRPKPQKKQMNPKMQQQKSQSQAREGSFARTKLKALKIYGELNQKVRQPISPGSKIASFLSSIFSSENVKKAKMCYVGAVEDVRFESHKSNKSPCFSSSVSSYSSRRSCMTKTPSSSRNNNGVKRSVRFYPVSVILGEDNSSQQQYTSYHDEPTLLPLSSSVRTRNSSIKELNMMKKKKNSVDYRDFYSSGEDEDDNMSCSSSDLFELDHLIGGQSRYQEELPVYETTNLETNKAIANGLRF